ncbi:MAG: FtsX-like permease family protein [Blautia sp.]|nr:FtsX-like permease family protein [Blautia sp.]MCM1201087.1 FtsX-like permease family protein [Bacteroides fragilis]
MSSGMIKTTIREIKGSFGRYIAILAIVMLGVSLFAGLKATTPAMIATENTYLAEQNFFDFRLLSTVGFDKEDVEELAAAVEAADVEGTISVDAICAFEDGNESVYKIHAVPETINRVVVTAGRMPQRADECVLDDALYGEEMLGAQITVTDSNDEDTLEMFGNRTFTAVGIVRSPCYINFERGTTSIGTGRISAFIYVPEEAFDCDYLTEIYVAMNQKYDVYTDEYQDYIDSLQDGMEEAAETLARQRYGALTAEAQEKIDDAQKELDDKKAEAEEELNDALQKIEDGEQELLDGEQELADGTKEIADGTKEIAEHEQELLDGEQEIIDGEQEIRDKELEIQDAEEELSLHEWEIFENEIMLSNSRDELAQAKETLQEKEAELLSQEESVLSQEAELEEQAAALSAQADALSLQETELSAQREALAAQDAGLAAQEAELNGQKAMLQEMMAGALTQEEYEAYAAQMGQLEAGLSQVQAGRAQVQAGIGQLDAGIGEIQAGRAQLEDGLSQIQAGRTQLDAGKAAIQDGKEQIAAAKEEIAYHEKVLLEAEEELASAKTEVTNARTELEDGKIQLADAKTELEEGKTELADGKEELAKAKTELADAQTELEEGRADLEEGRVELADARTEYEDAKAEFEEEVADAQQKIDDARAELADIEEPDSYALTRNTNIGYACYESDSNIVAAIANVFPIFFFLVAALICMTTMNRMVEEQRTQIGILKALGYGNAAIMGKFLFYAGSAAVLGAVLGLAGGTWLFPRVIWVGYGIMYSMGGIEYYFDIWTAIFSLAAALLCSMGAAYFSCRYELFSVPANLIRPKAPKSGKRIFLEKVTFLWSRMKFLHKVSVRNLVRYKKRFFMMILGISGCTALLVTGYGVKDSVMGIADMQYDEIQIFDIGITFSDGVQRADIDEMEERLGGKLERAACHYEESVDLDFGGKTKSVYLMIPENVEETGSFLNLHTPEGGPIPYPEKGGAVLTEKMAENMGIRAGDRVTLRDSDMNSFTVTISALCENFVYNYIYIDKETYTEQLSREPEYKSAYAAVKEGLDVHEAAAVISDMDNVLAVSVTQDMRERIGTMMESMNYIVALIIICAGSLAFIVLYNLTNINITERIREIATIKVLGFYAKETADYVFRENLMLTGMGAIVGLGLGKWLHWFVMYHINIDMISFKTLIEPISYFWSFVLTFVFAMFVNGLMFFKLEKINMAESLKSIE